MAGKKKSFTITWRIENYNLSSKQIGCNIESPYFVIDSVKNKSWMLEIWPNSPFKNNCITINVIRRENSLVNYKESDSEIFISTDNGTTSNAENSKWLIANSSTNTIPDFFVPHDKFYIKKEGAFVPPDVLIIRCRMNEPVESSEIALCSILTRIRVERTALMTYANNFSKMVPTEKSSLKIQTASVEKPSFALNLTLADGKNKNVDKENVWIEVIPANKTDVQSCVCNVFLVDSEGNKTECGRWEMAFREEEWKFPLNFTKNYLIKKNTQFLSNDTLTLKCEFAFSTGVEYERIEDCELGKIANVNKIQSKFPSALEDIARLYKESILCDIKLQTKTESFKAHKNILSARSSVFKTMFTTDMKEKTNDCVVIEDLEADTVRSMLMFIYSDNLEELDWEGAKSLYFAADKYDIKALKCRCSEFLVNNLQPSDSCDLLLLSDKHQDEELKKVVLEYISKHHQEVLQTNHWMNLVKVNPTLKKEALQVLSEKLELSTETFGT